MPKISVIMPVYNQEAQYLRDATESILRQTFQDFEFIMIDDGSTEPECIGTLTFYSAQDKRIRLARNEKNSGIVHSLNRGLEMATGEYIARMDSDDIALPERLERQISFLERHEKCDLVGSWVKVVDEKGKEIGAIRPPKDDAIIKSIVLQQNPLMHPTWMFRRSLIDKVGRYDPRAVNTEDYEFLLRIARNHEIRNIPEILLKYRFNTKGLSFGKNKVQERNALKIRFKALLEYGYPKSHATRILRPLFFYLFVPSFLKKILLKLSFRHA